MHLLRDCLGHARKDQHGLLAALIRPIFQAESGDQARQRLSEAIAALEQRLPKVAAMLGDAEEDVLAFYAFPAAHLSAAAMEPLLEKRLHRDTNTDGEEVPELTAA